MRRHDEYERRPRAVFSRLVSEGIVAPLSRDPSETRAWLDWELASLVEGTVHVELDVPSLSEEERGDRERRVTWRGRGLRSPHGEFRRAAWLLEDGERVGTIALDSACLGSLFSISSLYVRPTRRRRGIAGRALRSTHAAVIVHGGSGIRLAANWCWLRAVRFYVGLGMWVWNWKHSLVFAWLADLPPHRVEIEGDHARFAVLAGEEWRDLLAAERCGDRLSWRELPAYGLLRDPPTEALWLAPGTFALQLALEAWPLVRSAEHWDQRHGWSDAGEPEGLAYKIEIFEAIDRQQGFDVCTPRIPGLLYPDYADID